MYCIQFFQQRNTFLLVLCCTVWFNYDYLETRQSVLWTSELCTLVLTYNAPSILMSLDRSLLGNRNVYFSREHIRTIVMLLFFHTSIQLLFSERSHSNVTFCILSFFCSQLLTLINHSPGLDVRIMGTLALYLNVSLLGRFPYSASDNDLTKCI